VAAAVVLRVCMGTLCSVKGTVKAAARAQGGGCDGGRGAMTWPMACGSCKAVNRRVAVAQGCQ
jgi:hypothetical protein